MLDVNKIEKFSNLGFGTRKFLQLYRWKNCKPNKLAKLNKQLNQSNVAIISSAGLIDKTNHNPFDHKIKLGDTSFRIIKSDIQENDLEENHRSNSFNHDGIKSSPFTVLPINHLKELENQKFIGRTNHRHFSLMGSILNPYKLVSNTIPEIIKILKKDKVDIVILIPV